MKKRFVIMACGFFILVMPILIFIITGFSTAENFLVDMTSDEVALELPDLLITDDERQIFVLFKKDVDFIRAMSIEDYYIVLTNRAQNISKSFLPEASEIDNCTVYNSEINLIYNYDNKIVKLKNTSDGEIKKTVILLNKKGKPFKTYTNNSDKEFYKS